MESAALYEQYKTKMQKIADVKYASAVLQWDQETYLPPKGNDTRGRQIATLTEMAHEQFTHESVGELLHQLNASDDLSASQKRNVELSLQDYDRNRKVPAHFVRTLSEAVNKSFHAWIEARSKKDFSIFEPLLDQVITLKKQEAELLGYAAHPYDALMNDYDKGLTVEITDKLFASLKPALTQLLDLIKRKPQVDDSFLKGHFKKAKQWDLGIELLKQMGFDFNAGRQDISAHPFTINFSSKDVRVTTRIDEADLGNMIWSCIHEGGHALYEQGLPEVEYGLPLGEYCSLSIHESQSRLWENNVGRGMPYWEYNYSLLKKQFPEFNKVSVEQFFKGINKVSPSLIRTEADELTYHFHIMIRYEIEKQIIQGTLTTKEIPAKWNALYKEYLGVEPQNDAEGCLQDVHWSHGSFGYFATYSIGSLYAAQMFAAVLLQDPNVENDIRKGNNGVLLNWLRQHVHGYGRFYNSGELCRKATGEFLNSEYFISYATEKFHKIYVP